MRFAQSERRLLMVGRWLRSRAWVALGGALVVLGGCGKTDPGASRTQHVSRIVDRLLAGADSAGAAGGGAAVAHEPRRD